MFDFLNNKKLSGGFRKLLQPRKEFAEKTKTAFLTVFDAAHPASREAGSGFTAAVKALAAAGALVAVFAGISVYADTANVAADSPLYSLKRLGETVQLVMAPPQEKAQLQATFATRRAGEITDLETRKPTSTMISGLSTDLNTALNTSLNDAQSADLGDGQLTAFCDKVLSVITTSSIEVRHGGDSGSDDNIVGRFVSRCSGSIAGDLMSSSSVSIMSSSTEQDHGGSFGHFHEGEASTTASGTLEIPAIEVTSSLDIKLHGSHGDGHNSTSVSPLELLHEESHAGAL